MDSDNLGVLILPPRSRDWAAGGISGIEYKAVCEDWTPYLPENEWQKASWGDTMACVSYSCTNIIETQLNYLYKNLLLSDDNYRWLGQNGYMVNGKINLSARYVAKRSNTTDQGNYAVVVADVPRKIGMVPESLWPSDPAKFTSWEAYYSTIPPEVDNLASEFKQRFKTQYEFVYAVPAFGQSQPFPMDEVQKHVKQAPLQVLAPVCSPWNQSGVIQKCGIEQAQHATMYYGGQFRIRDQYAPFNKTLADNYFLPYVLKVIIQETMNTMTDEAKTFLATHDKKLVLATPSGRNAYSKGGKLMEIITSDRGALASLAVQREHGMGVTIPDALYDACDRQPF